ncbi:hypothetical protein BD779DRAFT_708490 [Infundibulicybe gibba]|nr:hypothetical protein BD779DRAFT_708490 [Infundibulicybe gibba]
MASMNAFDAVRWNICIVAFLTCGLALTCALTLTVILSKRLHRLNTWIAFISSLIIFCLTFLLLPISGYGGTVPPPFALCLFQASLAHAACPFVISSCACFMLEVHYMIYITLRCRPRSRWIHLLLLLPPLTHLLFFSFAISIGIGDPEHVTAASAAQGADVTRFCSVKSNALSHAATVYIAIAASGMAIASVYTTALVYSNWRDYRKLTCPSESQDEEHPCAFSLSVLVRLGLFFIIIVASLCLDLSWPDVMGISIFILDIMLVTLPLATVLIFGTQRDIMQTWARWLRIV